MADRIKILLISNYQSGVGGISGQVTELYNHLTEDGASVCVFTTKASMLMRLCLFFRLLLVSHQYDILHIHGCSYRGMLPIVYGVICGKCWRKRIIITYHGGEAAEYFAKHIHFVRKWLMKADERIVLSDFLKNIFDRYQIPCVVIPNIVSFASLNAKRMVVNPPIRFISVRHLRDLYNIPCILCAFEKVHRSVPNSTLQILGQGPLRSSLEQWVRKHGLTQNVVFVGQVPNTEISHYLSQSDVMLSAPHIDNMPVSVLEAMNAGVLVISSRVGGVPYIIDENRTGLFFADDNSDELAEKMIWAIEHSNDVQQLIDAAQIEVQKYKWDNIREKIYNVYGICLQ
ncbi:MAG: glycosyltransferase family 4 protein [Paludibacteraceae bacterium]|nr:glycosyltransferase family 4 protein [Paludibacteraceae bacterium]